MRLAWSLCPGVAGIGILPEHRPSAVYGQDGAVDEAGSDGMQPVYLGLDPLGFHGFLPFEKSLVSFGGDGTKRHGVGPNATRPVAPGAMRRSRLLRLFQPRETFEPLSRTSYHGCEVE